MTSADSQNRHCLTESLAKRLTEPLFARLHVTSIRSQLTLGIAATLVPCLAIGFYAVQQLVRARVYDLTERRLQAEAELISYGLRQWGYGLTDTASVLALVPAMREGRAAEIQSILNAMDTASPGRLWRFWTGAEKPVLQAYTGTITPQQKQEAERNQANRDYYQAALRGLPSYQVVLSRTTGRGCLNVAEPVFKRAAVTQSTQILATESVLKTPSLMAVPPRDDLAGVLVLCIPLERLGYDTGLVDLFKDQRMNLLAGRYQSDFLDDVNGVDSAVILVSNSGQLLFPDAHGGTDRIPTIADIKASRLSSLYPLAQQAMRGKELFATVSAQGERYYALTAKVDSAWSLVLLLNEKKALSGLDSIGHLQAAVGLLTVLLALLIVKSRSKAITRPMTVAGQALARISDGDFDIHVAATANDEMGGLLRNIQSAADRLKLYLAETTSFAVTQKQIDTAKAIQADFLLAELPSSPCYEVEALSRPALEIGADWYDMVDAGRYVVLIVADVCDKGVPSALYMSVFRSLIRSKLLEHAAQLGGIDEGSQAYWAPDQSALDADSIAADCIRSAIEQTNDYMAGNQNASMMFATVFIAAISKETGVVSYIAAGHESPVLAKASALRMLDCIGGPAIGLFGSVAYTVATTQLQPGDALVIYSDGLVDARNPANEGWGLARLQELLAHASDQSAAAMMRGITSAVDRHMAGADQFDDLTVMVLKWLGS